MRAARRAIVLCAAGLLPACGCTADVARPLARGQEPAPRTAFTGPVLPYPPPPQRLVTGRNPLAVDPPTASAAGDEPLSINLATALQLAGARPLDVQIAGRQVA